MTVEQARKKIIETIIEVTDTEEEVTEETLVVHELGLSSMEVLVMIGELEDIFGVDLNMKQSGNVKTVGQLCDMIIDQLRK